MKHVIIPVFIPELACPNRCAFCNQHTISGKVSQPSPDEVIAIVEERLTTVRPNSHCEIAFFGGSFTGIEADLQETYLGIAKKYGDAGKINGIRISTRPDYINPEVLGRLKRFGVTAIELGAQSLHDDVLELTGRGHTVKQVENAVRLINEQGFELGLQMMTGLPGDTDAKAIKTAQQIAELGAKTTRIYPTLVLQGTDLETRWRNGNYKPQTLTETVSLVARLLDIFAEKGIAVLRVGLHPSEDFKGGSLLDGPFHPNLRELAETVRWRKKLETLVRQNTAKGIINVQVPPGQLAYAKGYRSENKKWLETLFETVIFEPAWDRVVFASGSAPLPVKNSLRKLGKTEWVKSNGTTYKSVAYHPDIFMCQGREGIVMAPNAPENLLEYIETKGFFKGKHEVGRKYPDTARYNAVVTDRYIIHNLRITDPSIPESFPGRELIHVNQGYTRCNLLPLGDAAFITSDRGIARALNDRGMEALYVDSAGIKLKGEKQGFFGGCCGIYDHEILVAGSLSNHPQRSEIESFAQKHGYRITELFPGGLTDIGSILVHTFAV